MLRNVKVQFSSCSSHSRGYTEVFLKGDLSRRMNSPPEKAYPYVMGKRDTLDKSLLICIPNLLRVCHDGQILLLTIISVSTDKNFSMNLAIFTYYYQLFLSA